MIAFRTFAPIAIVSVFGISATGALTGALNARHASTVEHTDFDKPVTGTTRAKCRSDTSEVGTRAFRSPCHIVSTVFSST